MVDAKYVPILRSSVLPGGCRYGHYEDLEPPDDNCRLLALDGLNWSLGIVHIRCVKTCGVDKKSFIRLVVIGKTIAAIEAVR